MELTDINEIKALLARHGFRFSRSMGQNFLCSSSVPEHIAQAAELDEGVGVLEIGPGIGCLTEKLAERAGKVVAVELDETLRPLLCETVGGLKNVEIVYADVLKTDLSALINEKLPNMRCKVCANLPYNITAPTVKRLLGCAELESATLMVQREVARRMCAKPATGDYGAFSVLVQWSAEPEPLFDVPPECFVPRPKITSSVVTLRRRQSPPAPVKDEGMLFRVVKAAFAQRRKTLTNALASGFPELGRETVEKSLVMCGIDPKRRGETLSIGEFAIISDAFGKLSE